MASEHHSRKTARQGEKEPASKGSAYTPLPDHYAVHDRPPGAPAPGAVLVLEDGAVAVFRGAPDERTRRTARIGPVYRSEKGRLIVPTGRVLLRFREGVSADSRRPDIEAAGYEIEEVPPYAPNAAWVRRKGGDIAGSASARQSLRKLADVENIEPQLLSRNVSRS